MTSCPAPREIRNSPAIPIFPPRQRRLVASPKLHLVCVFFDLTRFMGSILRAFVVALSCGFRSRRDLVPENLAHRQQLAVLAAKHPRPRLASHDRLFWVTLRRWWTGWKRALLIVQPQTVVSWHRAGFKVYWKWMSRRRLQSGRRPTSKALREIISRMAAGKPT